MFGSGIHALEQDSFLGLGSSGDVRILIESLEDSILFNIYIFSWDGARPARSEGVHHLA